MTSLFLWERSVCGSGGRMVVIGVFRPSSPPSVDSTSLERASGFDPRTRARGLKNLADFVLSPFTAEERKRMDEVLERVVSATRMLLAEGIAKAMSRYNASAG